MAVQELGRKQVWLVESEGRPYKPYLVVQIGREYACACPSVAVCRHVRLVEDYRRRG